MIELVGHGLTPSLFEIFQRVEMRHVVGTDLIERPNQCHEDLQQDSNRLNIFGEPDLPNEFRPRSVIDFEQLLNR